MTKHCHLQVVKGMGIRDTRDGTPTVPDKPQGGLVLIKGTKRSWVRPQMATAVADV